MSMGRIPDLESAVRKVFLMVSNIPYGGVGRRDTLAAALENSGSCSSKHQLLAELLAALGVETRSMMGLVELKTFGRSLRQPILLGSPVRDFHNFLQVRLNGQWVQADATFGKNEAAMSLPDNLDWDGRSDCRLLFPVIRAWEVRSIFLEKEKALRALPEEERALRDGFFQAFNARLAESRAA